MSSSERLGRTRPPDQPTATCNAPGCFQPGRSRQFAIAGLDGRGVLHLPGQGRAVPCVLDRQAAQRVRDHVNLLLDARTMEEGFRASHATWRRSCSRTRAGSPSWTHASRQEPLRLEVIKRHERTLDALTALLDEVAAATASSTRLPTWSGPQHLRPLAWHGVGAACGHRLHPLRCSKPLSAYLAHRRAPFTDFPGVRRYQTKHGPEGLRILIACCTRTRRMTSPPGCAPLLWTDCGCDGRTLAGRVPARCLDRARRRAMRQAQVGGRDRLSAAHTPGLTALMIAPCRPSATSWVKVTLMSANPTAASPLWYSLTDRAPAMQAT